MKKLKKKIRRHPKPEKFWGTILMAVITFFCLLFILGYEKQENPSEIKIIQAHD